VLSLIDPKGIDANMPKEKLLIIEDDVSLASYLEEHFKTYFEVQVAHDGQEGYESACSFKPHAIISDVRMPKLSGVNLVKKVRRTPGLEATGIVLISVLSEKADRIRGYESLADLYFSKPFDIEELTVSVIGLVKIRDHMRKSFISQTDEIPEPVVGGISDEDAKFLYRLSEAVEHRLADLNLTVDEIAASVHLSKRSLERRLKDLEDISPASFIRQTRLEEAKKILQLGNGDSIQDVASRVGYKSVSAFKKQFEAHFGYPPQALL
jgi:DNA-binding response OmpR family regulator